MNHPQAPLPSRCRQSWSTRASDERTKPPKPPRPDRDSGCCTLRRRVRIDNTLWRFMILCIASETAAHCRHICLTTSCPRSVFLPAPTIYARLLRGFRCVCVCVCVCCRHRHLQPLRADSRCRSQGGAGESFLRLLFRLRVRLCLRLSLCYVLVCVCLDYISIV